MLSIFSFFFRRGREEEDVPTREEVDWETYWETGIKYCSYASISALHNVTWLLSVFWNIIIISKFLTLRIIFLP